MHRARVLPQQPLTAHQAGKVVMTHRCPLLPARTHARGACSPPSLITSPSSQLACCFVGLKEMKFRTGISSERNQAASSTKHRAPKYFRFLYASPHCFASNIPRLKYPSSSLSPSPWVMPQTQSKLLCL